MPSALLQDLVVEVDQFTEKDLHPKVDALVVAFLTYLKEPRYQNPLTLCELKEIFTAFYEDLNSLVFHIYTQSNTNKRSLLRKSEIFRSDPRTFDYLNAIANYSSSSVKLSKRTDAEALYQLRVFGFYKFITILKTIELAHLKLYSSSSSSDSTSLYEKVFRFDSEDIELHTLLSKKIEILRKLKLPLSCFFESNEQAGSSELGEVLSCLEASESIHMSNIKAAFTQLAVATTPASKLQLIVAIQKSILELCASCYGNNSSNISNDILLPAFIYVIVNHSPPDVTDETLGSYLHFAFVRNFWKPLDLQRINTTKFTLNSSLSGYNPMEKSITTSKSSQEKTLADLLNLNGNTEPDTDCAEDKGMALEFSSDQELMNLISQKYSNSGELQFCLTNCEAIFFFLSSTPIVDFVPETMLSSLESIDNDLSRLSLLDIIHKKADAAESADTSGQKDLDKLLDEEFNNTSRSRSSSLFNTISNAVSQSVERSRSNSAAKAVGKDSHSHMLDFESSIRQFQGPGDNGLNRMRGIFDKIGQVSHLQLKHLGDDIEGVHDVVDHLERTPESGRAKRTNSFFDKLSPISNRTRSGSLETNVNGQNANLRRATLTSKFSTGVSELMTKLGSAANTATGSTLSVTAPESNDSQSSLHTIEDPFEDASFAKRENLGARSSSLQTMEKWFCNIPESEDTPAITSTGHRSNNSLSSNQLDSNYHDGSVFSASFGELTKFRFTEFESMTIKDLKDLKSYYDQLCSEVLSGKAGSKTSNEYLSEDKEVISNVSSLDTHKDSR